MDAVIGVLIFVIALFAVITLIRSVRIVPQQRMDVVERLGRYQRTLKPGLNLLMPFIDAVRTKVDMREQVVSFPPQPVITSDNLVVSIDTVLYFKVVDPVRATYEIANFLQAIGPRGSCRPRARPRRSRRCSTRSTRPTRTRRCWRTSTCRRCRRSRPDR